MFLLNSKKKRVREIPSFNSRPITLPQQPLPVVQAIQTSTTSTQLKSISTNGSFPVNTFSSMMPKLANSTPFQQQQNETRPSNNVTHLPSSFLPTTTTSLNRIENELSCPPEDLFDSEDASSVATTTEAPSPISSLPNNNDDDDDDNEVKDFNFLSDHIDENISFVDDDAPMDNIVETSTVNVIVTSRSLSNKNDLVIVKAKNYLILKFKLRYKQQLN